MLACGLSGPRRVAAGSLRDFVLGVTLMDGQGRVVRFGGQVMKNVAGFDVSRLIAGSFGTLGLILESDAEGAAATAGRTDPGARRGRSLRTAPHARVGCPAAAGVGHLLA
jgi:hypothetical protein